MLIGRALSTLIFVAAVQSAAAERLTLKAACPEKERLACLETHLNNNGAPSEDVDVTVVTRPLAPSGYPIGPDILKFAIAVKGRLNGGPLTAYTITSERDSRFEDTYEEIGQVAFLGRSPANHPVLLTNRGALEIVSNVLDVEYGRSFAVADTRTWRLWEPFLELAGDSYVASTPDNFSVWKRKQNLCIAAPTRKPGMLQLRTGCKENNWAPGDITLAQMRKLFDDAHIVEETDEEKKRAEFGGEGNYYWVWRLPKTHILIISWVHDDC